MPIVEAVKNVCLQVWQTNNRDDFLDMGLDSAHISGLPRVVSACPEVVYLMKLIQMKNLDIVFVKGD